MSTRHCQPPIKLRHHCCKEHRKLALRILGIEVVDSISRFSNNSPQRQLLEKMDCCSTTRWREATQAKIDVPYPMGWETWCIRCLHTPICGSSELFGGNCKCSTNRLEVRHLFWCPILSARCITVFFYYNLGTDHSSYRVCSQYYIPIYAKCTCLPVNVCFPVCLANRCALLNAHFSFLLYLHKMYSQSCMHQSSLVGYMFSTYWLPPLFLLFVQSLQGNTDHFRVQWQQSSVEKQKILEQQRCVTPTLSKPSHFPTSNIHCSSTLLYLYTQS